MNWDAAQTCQHSLSKCGDCRALEHNLSANGLAAVDAEVEAYRQKKLAEYWAIHQQAAPNQPQWPLASAQAAAALAPEAPCRWNIAACSGGGKCPHQDVPRPELQPLRLDLGCGTRKQPGFVGVDVRQFGGVDVVCDLGSAPWPWPDASVEEVFCSHALEHVPRGQRPHFFNELYRVLKPGAKAMFITPHWASCRAYGDVTHEWPPISEFFWPYLDKQWRKDNAPHNDMYTCDFTAGYGYTIAAWLQGRNQEFVQDALTKCKEAAQDMQATVVARK